MNRALRSFLLSLTVGALAAPCFAGDLSASCNVSVANGVKTFAYTFTLSRVADPNTRVTDIWISMPKIGASNVTTKTCSRTQWMIYTIWNPNSPDAICGTTAWDGINGKLLAGQSITLSLKTAANVQTVYYYPPGRSGAGNWGYGIPNSSQAGLSLLPVPGDVPEPSSILALSAGLLPIGAILRRKRK